MGAGAVSEAEVWAEEHFGQVELGDRRRTKRVVSLAASMLSHPAASLPRQTGNWSATKASYRLFNREAVTLEALQNPHWQATRHEAQRRGVVLMIQDTSELDYTFHWNTEGLEPIGNGKGRGFLLHSTLAVDPCMNSGERWPSWVASLDARAMANPAGRHSGGDGNNWT